MEILSTLLSGGAGGLFGVLGSLGGAFFKAKERKADREHELSMRSADRADRQAGHTNDMETVRETSKANALVSTIQAQGAATGIKSLFRPFLTTLLVIMSGWIFYTLVSSDELTVYFDVDERAALIRYVVCSIIFTASTAVTWWFGDRALAPPTVKHL